MPAWDQEADFEENDLSDFDATSGTGLSASTSADRLGTYGMAVAITDTTVRYGEFTGPTAETAVTMELWFDLNALSMSSGDKFVIAGNPNSDMAIEFRLSGSDYQVRITARDDAAAFDVSSWYTIPDDWHLIRMIWQASSGPGNDDGFMELHINGQFKERMDGLDNDTRVVDELRFGAPSGLDAGTSGTCYFDNCRWFAGIDYPQPPVIFQNV